MPAYISDCTHQYQGKESYAWWKHFSLFELTFVEMIKCKIGWKALWTFFVFTWDQNPLSKVLCLLLEFILSTWPISTWQCKIAGLISTFNPHCFSIHPDWLFEYTYSRFLGILGARSQSSLNLRTHMLYYIAKTCLPLTFSIWLQTSHIHV